MSDTYRRLTATHEYAWLLRPLPPGSCLRHTLPRITAASPEGRRLLARFHADSHRLTWASPPRWARKVSDHRLRTRNDRELRRALIDPEYDPVFVVNHRHEARWDWY